MSQDMSQEKSTWEYVPSVMQLIEEGLEPGDLGGRKFAAPSVRGGGLVSSAPTPTQLSKLDRMWAWLKGFRKDEVVCERLPIWVPIAELWPAPGGGLEFSYETSVESGSAAEISVSAVVGFGGGSRLKLASSVELQAKGRALAYMTRAFLTIQRYRNGDGEQMDVVDVDCKGEYAEFDQQERSPDEHPLGTSPLTVEEIRAKGFTVSRVERCAGCDTETAVKVEQESLRHWKFELMPELPLLKAPVNLAASCERARSFSTKFSLPPGRDYAFCIPSGESPVVPVCVALK